MKILLAAIAFLLTDINAKNVQLPIWDIEVITANGQQIAWGEMLDHAVPPDIVEDQTTNFKLGKGMSRFLVAAGAAIGASATCIYRGELAYYAGYMLAVLIIPPSSYFSYYDLWNQPYHLTGLIYSDLSIESHFLTTIGGIVGGAIGYLTTKIF